MKNFFKYFCLFFFIILLLFLSINVKIDGVVASEKFPFNGVINADALGVHNNEKINSEKTQLVYGTRITVLSSHNTGKSGICANSYKISYAGGNTGYVCAGYVVNVDTNVSTANAAGVETYNDYCNAMKAKGFPDSYCPYLYYLHSKHPKWVFNADIIGKDIMEVANAEQGKCVLQSSNTNYWLNSNPIEGSYYYINSKTISSFLDPRNSLFEGSIFQFLDFVSSKDIANDESLKKIVGNGNLSRYFNEFKTAATKNGVNALHLISRSTQEGANKKTILEDKTIKYYESVSGTYTRDTGRKSLQGYSLDGYYNFYNINTYLSAGYQGTVQRGLSWAAGFMEENKCFSVDGNGKAYYDTKKCGALSLQRPWNTPAVAISGGAEFIANRYVHKGQGTNYFQKFNVSSSSATEKYSNQYMTNVHAPASEGNIISSAYQAGGLMDNAFTFIIPVYNNMSATPYQAVDKSNDNKLKSIKVDGNVITGFDSDVTEYNYNAITANNYVDIVGVVNNNAAKVSGAGRINFTNGTASVTLSVTAEDGSVKKYVVNIKQIVPNVNIKINDIISKMAVKVSGDYMYGISPDTAVSTIVNTVVNNGGNSSVTDKAGKAKGSGALVTGDKITIKGTSETKTFVIAVRGDCNGDGKVSIVDLLLIQKDILGRGSLVNQLRLAGDVNYDGKISIVDLLLIQKHILGKGNL